MKSVSRQATFLAEVLAIGTAASFILSGLANAAIFWTAWKLNYFVIATPSDVVMTAFIFMALLLVIAAPISTVILWGIARARSEVARKKTWAEANQQARTVAIQRLKRGGKTAADPEIELAANQAIAEAIRRDRLRMIANLITGFLSVSATLVVYWLAVTTAADPAPPPRGDPIPARQFSYATGLRLAPAESTGPDCWAAPVLWMGTDRMVLGCQPGVRVVTVSDALVLQSESLRVPSRPLFLLQRESDVLNDQVQGRLRSLSSEDQVRTILEMLIQDRSGPALPATTKRSERSTSPSESVSPEPRPVS